MVPNTVLRRIIRSTLRGPKELMKASTTELHSMELPPRTFTIRIRSIRPQRTSLKPRRLLPEIKIEPKLLLLTKSRQRRRQRKHEMSK